MRKILSLCAAMLVAFAVNAAVINIDNTTSNALQAALNSAATGDIIEMAAGTYEESGNYLAFTGKELTVRAAEGAEVIIKTVCPVRLKEGAKAEFINVKFDCSTIGDYEQVIVAADESANKRVVLSGCEFYGWAKNKAMIQATSSRGLAAITIDNCYFHDCMKSVVFVENTGAIDLSITNSTFANISTDTESFWAGVIDSRATSGSLLIDHCTFYNVQAMNTDYAAVGKVATPGAIVSNSIFTMPSSVDGVRAIRDVSEAKNCLTYNYIKDGGGIYSSVTKTNCALNQDPLFKDAANGDFTLGDGSAALTLNDGQPIGDPRWVPSAPVIEPKTYYGAEGFLTEGAVIDPAIWVAAEWSITRNADKTLTFVIDFSDEITGLVPKVNLGDYIAMDYTNKQATYTTTATYEDGTALTGAFFYLEYAGAAKRIDIPGAYKVGDENEKPAPPVMTPIASTYFATGGTWEADTESSAVWDATKKEITVNIVPVKVAQWQAQVKVDTRLLPTPFKPEDDKPYVLSVKFHANQAVNGVTVKYHDNMELVYADANINLPADADFVWTSESFLGKAGNNIIVFDFGWAAANSNIVISEITFAEIKSCADVYKMAKGDAVALNDVTVTYVNGKNVYVKDETGSMLLYLPAAATWKAGDVLSGLAGVIDVFNGLYEVKPSAEQVAAVTATPGEAPAPAELIAIPGEADINKYVILKGVNVTGEFTTASATNLDATFGNGQFVLRNYFKIAQTFEEGKTYDIIGTGAVYEKSGTRTIQLYFISATEHTTTAINNAVVSGKAVKMIENGQLIIMKNGVKYNAQGAELR